MSLPPGFTLEQPAAAPPTVAAPPVSTSAPAALPAGFQLEDESQVSVPAYEVPEIAANADELRVGLDKLYAQKVPVEAIRDYIANSGFSLDESGEAWLDNQYAEHVAQEGNVLDGSLAAGPPPPEISGLGSAWSGMKSGALRGFDDEWSALWGAIGNRAGTALGMNESTAGFGDIYDAVLEQERAYKDQAYEQNMLAYGAGFIPGMLMGPSYSRAMGGPGAGTGRRVAGAMGIGAVEGGLSGMGNAEGGLVDRAVGAMTGAGTGAALGGVLYPLAPAAGWVASRVGERLGPRVSENSLNSGLEALIRRAPQDPAAVAARAAEMEAAGVPPRVVDVVDESGRGVIRDAASKMTPARQEVVEHADTVYIDAQDRVANQARRNINPSPATSRQIADLVEREQRELGPQFDAVRSQPVRLTDGMIQAFSTAEGRNVLRSIGRWMTPEEQGALTQFIGAIRSASTIDPRLPEAIKQQMREQVMAGSPLTVDIADKFARILTRRAREEPALLRVAQEYANTVRAPARQQYPDYDEALTQYEGLARVGEAASGTGRYEGSDFLRAPPDQYAPIVEGANRDMVQVGDETFPSERMGLDLRARDEVVDAATSNAGQNAMRVARQISRGSAQRQRNEALLGEEGARQFESGMRQEVTRVDNTRFIDPRTGSQTQSRGQDAAADDAMNFAADAATSGKWGLVRGAARWLRAHGIRGVDAERLVRDAISEDRNDVQDAITYLTRRGVEVNRARSMVRAISAAMAGRSAGALTASEEPPTPPNSVRAILREGGR